MHNLINSHGRLTLKVELAFSCFILGNAVVESSSSLVEQRDFNRKPQFRKCFKAQKRKL